MKKKQDTVFVSYRSTPYDELRDNGCKAISKKEECTTKSALSCQYLNCAFRKAAIFVSQLQCKYYILSPYYMLPPESLLRVSEFYEKSILLSDIIGYCKNFIRFEIKEDSFWTNFELKLWREHSLRLPENKYYEIYINENSYISRMCSFPKMNKFEANSLRRLLYYSNREYHNDHAWGAYSDCFICICPNCGKITLYSLAALKYMIRHQIGIDCTFCGHGPFLFNSIEKGNNEISYSYRCKRNISFTMDEETIIKLLLKSDDDVLKGIHLICLSHEYLTEIIPLKQMFVFIASGIKKMVSGSHLEIRFYEENLSKLVRKALSIQSIGVL